MSNTPTGTGGSVNFGTCWSTATGDLTMPAQMAAGVQAVAEMIVRRWSMVPGTDPSDPSAGINLPGYVNSGLTPRQLNRIGTQASAQAEADERVRTCQAACTLVAGVMLVAARVVTATGPFKLVASVTAISVTLLQVQP